MTILLKTLGDVSTFVSICKEFESDINLTYGRNTVDAKSYLGVTAIGLCKNVKVDFVTADYDEVGLFEEMIKEYIVNE